MTIFGHACLSRATSGGSTSAPATSLAATRTHATQLGSVATEVSRRAFQRPGGIVHRLGVHPQRQRRVGRQQAGLRAGK
ncbi:Uncharacterised protein [Klebsiella pneumoniae]|uniref:Uncharacterized protein n=1 Tax=Klebsiella pneumoniae TaxID=573 RepID=A0A377XA15_KLEPN|nr:Uncharacterised protein [Klebsiella pneumoniae]